MNALDGKITMKKLLALVRESFLWLLLLPYALIYTGAASNQAVLIANHSEFPVRANPAELADFVNSPEDLARLEATGMIDSIHCVMTDKTHLNFLADIFDFHGSIYSVGDGFIEAGEGLQYPLMISWFALALYRAKQRLQ